MCSFMISIQPVVLTTPDWKQRAIDIARPFGESQHFCEPIIHCDNNHLGAAMSSLQAIQNACRAGSHVLFLEDDLVVDSSAPERISAVDFPDDVAVISFCDMREIPEFSEDGLYSCSALGSDGFGWWGNQALLIHWESARMLALSDWFSAEIEASKGLRSHRILYEDDGRNCSDIRMALLVHHHGAPRSRYAVHVPSLLLHVGNESRCFPGRRLGERQTRNWIGDRRKPRLQPLPAWAGPGLPSAG